MHRDIKPDNIMIDPATGRAKLMDFGLARDEASDESLTREDVLAGTPTHMSPEQARGLPLDGRSDVYSLGVTLYECLTGEVPFRGTPHMVLQQVCDDEPRPPRRLNDRIPRNLETVCLKAMAKEPSRRYATARDLADDLRRWLNGEPIRARPPGPGRAARPMVPAQYPARGPRRHRVRPARAAHRRLLGGGHADRARAAADPPGATRPPATITTWRWRRSSRWCWTSTRSWAAAPGTLQLKRDILETARAGLEKIARSTEAAGTIDRSAVVAYDQLGRVLFALGRTPDAFRAYEKSRDLAEALAKAHPGFDWTSSATWPWPTTSSAT